MIRDDTTNQPDEEDRELLKDLAALPRSITPPADLWPDIKGRLAPRRPADRPPLTLLPASAPAYFRVRQALGWHLGAIRAAASVAGLVVGLGVLVAIQRTQATWHVAQLAGSPRLGAEEVARQRVYRVGYWLTTDDSSRAILEVGTIGQVEVDANTRVRLVRARATEQRLALEHGRIHARISAPPRLFFVETPSATAVDLGCAYDLEVDEHGNGVLRVTLGWVSFGRGDRESLVPAGMRVITRAGLGVGAPYADDAPEALRRALVALDFEHGGDSALASVLREARPRDAITLWHLLSRVHSSSRDAVYDRLAALAPPPRGVTREGALRLDHVMLRLWWETLPGSLPITSDWGKTLWRIWLRLTDW